MHGSDAGQVARASDYRLSIAELAAADGRPLRMILQDACRLGDVAMRDYEQAVLHGETSADTVARLLEACRYSAGMVKLALDSGISLDPQPSAELTTVDSAAQLVVAAAMGCAQDLITLLLPLRDRADVSYRDALRLVARDRMAAAVRGEPLPPWPERPPLAEIVSEPPVRRGQQGRGDVVDAELVDDDPDTDEPGDAELLADIERLRAMVAAG
jgi:hypothetical protein